MTDALNHATSYGYDAMSNLTSMTDALSRVTNYEYDDFNRLKKIIYPSSHCRRDRVCSRHWRMTRGGMSRSAWTLPGV